jgi:hypothetical protein
VFGLFPKKDFDQTLRIKRFLMAFGAYIIWSAICFIGYSLELTTVPLRILVAGISASFVLNILLYVIFRTGLNKSFKDPSLTLLQMVIATFWIMVVVYYAYEARSGVLLVYMVVLVFGFFRLRIRQFLFLSAFAFVNYSAMVCRDWRIHLQPQNQCFRCPYHHREADEQHQGCNFCFGYESELYLCQPFRKSPEGVRTGRSDETDTV